MLRTILSLTIVWISVAAFSQPVKEDFSPKALEYFIAGKSAELRDDNKFALELYKTALKEEQAGGIYFAIANVYVKLGRYQDALIDINNAPVLRKDNCQKYKQLINHRDKKYFLHIWVSGGYFWICLLEKE